jgi:hypothetical protein
MKRLFAFALCGAVGLMAALPTAYAQQKTVKACEEEWRANKAANQAKKVTEKAYVEKCRAEPSTAAVGANQYTTVVQAKLHCPLDTVVWVNLSSKIYHFAGHKDYGKTKEGAYMCEKAATGAGARAAKDEKHP